MFGLSSKLPISEEERVWVDDSFHRLSRMLTSRFSHNSPVILPNDEFFPDPHTRDEAGLNNLFRRVCSYMKITPSDVHLEIIPDASDLVAMLPAYSMRGASEPAGLHFGPLNQKPITNSPFDSHHDEFAPTTHTENHDHIDTLPLIAIRKSLLEDPLLVVATLAHELSHVILLDGKLIHRDADDMEPLTDLLTVYLGFGIFTANAARRFTQHQSDRKQGWSMRRLGYLPEEVFAYALARYAIDRGEPIPPAWFSHLSTNLKAYFKQSAKWLQNQSRPIE
jgi:hypothetical protein